MGGKELFRAKKLLQRKKYTEVIRILEPQVFRFRESQDFYYLLGISYFHTGDIAGARTYLRRVLDLQPDHIHSMLYLAVIELKNRNNPKAIELWLNVLESDSKNSYALKGLDLLKKGSNDTAIVDKFLEGNKTSTLLPKKRNSLPFIIGGIIVLVFVVPFTVVLMGNISLFSMNREVRNADIESISISKKNNLINVEGEYTYILTEKEIIGLLEQAKKDFNNYRDNKVQIIINKISNSNASENVKDKISLMEPYLKKPDFTTLKNTILLEDIESDPLLYEKCYIRWKGKISNLKIGEDVIRFDFLVGYQDAQVLEGIVPVYFNFAVALENGDPVEIIGQVEQPMSDVRIKGTSVRPIAPGDIQ